MGLTASAALGALGSLGSAAGGALASGAGAALGGLGSAASALGLGSAGAGLGSAGAALSGLGSGGLGSAGLAALGGSIPADITFAAPTAALSGAEAATMLPASASLVGPPSLGAFTGGAAPSAFSQVGTGIQNGLNAYSNFTGDPGQSLGGWVGKQFGNEQLGSQLGHDAGQLSKLMGGGGSAPQSSPLAPPRVNNSDTSLPSPFAAPAAGASGGPSFHINPRGILEYS